MALRRRVVETALSLFSEHGYGAVSVEMICEAAQVSVGSLYHHFDSKGGVATEVYAEAIRRYHEPLLDVVDSDPDAEDGVRSLVAAHHRWVATHSDWARFMVSNGDIAEIRASAADHDAANARLAGALMAWARRHMNDGRLRSVDMAVFMAILFGPSYFHTRASLRLSPDPSDRGRGADFAAAAWRSLQGPAAAPTR